MLDPTTVSRIFSSISALMEQNRDYLVELDQVNGDGDLGISMDDGFKAAAAFFARAQETDLGQLLRQGGKVLNEAAPSSLGTILTFGLMGMARRLRGNREADFVTAVEALNAGVQNMMDKAESKPGEKTILDALVPGVETLRSQAEEAAGDAEAERALNVGKAEAEATSAKAEAMRAYGEAAVLQMVVDQLPSIVREMAAPLSSIDQMSVVSTDGATPLVKTVASGIGQTTELVKGLTGVDLAGLFHNASTDATNAPDVPGGSAGSSSKA